ncbi:hypothetical protein [Nocardioides rubriscoriae]|uniref:hypothetical protein n=1 Tax=Nocardioides rubriscoriae TaxID=642762 RepID=UPI0014792C0E|nr:hypothetical protein [Nocardioides rubriscoriae]
MELVVLPAVRDVDPASGGIVVAHDQSGLRTTMVPGEEVVLLDVDGEFHAGVITALSVRDGRLHYAIRQGVRLPSEAAHDRLDESPAPDPGRATTKGVTDQSLLDLLGELRDTDDEA